VTVDHKEICRVFYLVKGHLNSSEQTIHDSYNSYIKRLWFDGSNGAPLYEYEDGFDEAYAKKYLTQNN